MSRPQARPLSPFWIYRLGWTMGLSGTHRITGMLLAIGVPLFVLWLMAVAAGNYDEPIAYQAWFEAATSPFGILVYGGFVFCLCYHLCNGLRHLAWDLGKGFAIPTARASGAVVVVASLLLTAFVLASTFGWPA